MERDYKVASVTLKFAESSKTDKDSADIRDLALAVSRQVIPKYRLLQELDTVDFEIFIRK